MNATRWMTALIDSRPRRVALRTHRLSSTRRGFTLVEMLVAVALVVLMMSLFAQVFSIATGSMSKQKGLAENDQKARLIQTLIQGDVQKRSYRKVLALASRQAVPFPTLQQGYFHVSENDPLDDTDDTLQFSIAINNVQRNKDQTPLYGRTVPLVKEGTAFSATDYALKNPNQPELDDGQVVINNVGTSSVGEVCYFLRNGTLYRRVMLLRTPYVGDETNPQGYDDNGTNLQDLIADRGGMGDTDPYVPGTLPGYLQPSINASGVFWQDFDYSAINLNALDGTKANLPVFLGTTGSANYLVNSYDSSVGVGVHVPSLGMPNMRWGFSILLDSGTAGQPREWVREIRTGGATRSENRYFGRFTHEETSNVNFTYPGSWNAASYPMTRSSLILNLDTGVIEQYAGGIRRGEDIVMTNVHAFDIKVYDDHANVQNFVDIGNSNTGSQAGYYSRVNCSNTNWGPLPAGNALNNVFDTWHPNFDTNKDNTDNEHPPYRPVDDGPDGAAGIKGKDDDGDGMIDEADEQGAINSDDLHPLKSIQIHLRYLDTTSNQMRDLTITQSLVD